MTASKLRPPSSWARADGSPPWAEWNPPWRPMWWVPGAVVAVAAFLAWLPFAALYQMSGDSCSPGGACLHRIDQATGLLTGASVLAFVLALSGSLVGRRSKHGVWLALSGLAVLLVGLGWSFWLATTTTT